MRRRAAEEGRAGVPVGKLVEDDDHGGLWGQGERWDMSILACSHHHGDAPGSRLMCSPVMRSSNVLTEHWCLHHETSQGSRGSQGSQGGRDGRQSRIAHSLAHFYIQSRLLSHANLNTEGEASPTQTKETSTGTLKPSQTRHLWPLLARLGLALVRARVLEVDAARLQHVVLLDEILRVAVKNRQP